MAQSLCDSYLTCRWLLKAAVWLDTTHMSRAKHSHSNLKLTGSGNKIFSVARNHDARGRLSSSNYFLRELLEIARLRFGDSPKSDGGKIKLLLWIKLWYWTETILSIQCPDCCLRQTKHDSEDAFCRWRVRNDTLVISKWCFFGCHLWGHDTRE